MNREIKFRAFDRQTKKMSPEFVLFGEFTLMGAVHAWQHEGENKSSCSLEALNDLEVMQFTGLKDKNGKEIYEGDIIKCNTSNKFKYPHKGEVIYLQHVCGFGITTDPIVNESTGEEESAFTYFNYNENFEVIGNIHETPELL